MTFFVSFNAIMKQLLDLFFCDIQNNQGLAKGCQPRPLGSADKPLPWPCVFWISQRPHPVIVVYWPSKTLCSTCEEIHKRVTIFTKENLICNSPLTAESDLLSELNSAEHLKLVFVRFHIYSTSQNGISMDNYLKSSHGLWPTSSNQTNVVSQCC